MHFLLTFHGNYVFTLHRFSDIARYLLKITDYLLDLCLAPSLVMNPLEIC